MGPDNPSIAEPSCCPCFVSMATWFFGTGDHEGDILQDGRAGVSVCVLVLTCAWEALSLGGSGHKTPRRPASVWPHPYLNLATLPPGTELRFVCKKRTGQSISLVIEGIIILLGQAHPGVLSPRPAPSPMPRNLASHSSFSLSLAQG